MYTDIGLQLGRNRFWCGQDVLNLQITCEVWRRLDIHWLGPVLGCAHNGTRIHESCKAQARGFVRIFLKAKVQFRKHKTCTAMHVLFLKKCLVVGNLYVWLVNGKKKSSWSFWAVWNAWRLNVHSCCAHTHRLHLEPAGSSTGFFKQPLCTYSQAELISSSSPEGQTQQASCVLCDFMWHEQELMGTKY